MAWKNPGAGKLNKRITVRERIDHPVGDSEIEEGYSAQFKRWASIEPVGTGVYSGSVQTDTRITHRVIMRYLPGVTDSHEVVHGSTVYRVRRSTAMKGENRFTVLEVEEL